MSWPVLACASAAMVMVIFLPMAVRKSSWTSTLFFSAQALITLRMASLPAGTQWSLRARLSRPAAPAVWMLTSGSVEAAAPRRRAWRRVRRVFIGVNSLDGRRFARFLNVAEYSPTPTRKQVVSIRTVDTSRMYQPDGPDSLAARSTTSLYSDDRQGLRRTPHDPG